MEVSYTYLASPYSHPDQAVMEQRFQAVCKAASALMLQGELIFSPIAHTHPIAIAGELPRGWYFWQLYDEVMIRQASMLKVLMLDGWKESNGVQAEIEIANRLLKPVAFMDALEQEPGV